MATEIIPTRHECYEELTRLKLLYNEEHERADKLQAELEQLKALEDYPTFVHYIEGYRKRTAEMHRAQEEAKRLKEALDAVTRTVMDKERELENLNLEIEHFACLASPDLGANPAVTWREVAVELYNTLYRAWMILDGVEPNHIVTEEASKALDRYARDVTGVEKEITRMRDEVLQARAALEGKDSQ